MTDAQLIEAYFFGELSPEERQLFERKKVESAEFRAEVELQREILTAVDMKVEEELKEKFQKIEQDIRTQMRPSPPKSQAKSYRWPLSIAAGIAALLALWFIFLKPKATTEELLALGPYRNVVEPIDRGTEDLNVRQQAFFAYEQGEYEQALAQFEALLADSLDADVLFYAANAEIALERYKKAEKRLEALLIQPNRNFNRQGKWYLAGVKLELGEEKAAKALLEDLAASEGYKQDEAKAVLGKID